MPSEKKPKNTRSRGWCFTVQNPTDDDMALVSSLFEDDHNATYLIIGDEIAPRSGTPHLQCYIYYTNKVSFSQITERLPGVHVEDQKAKKNVEAYCYCMDDGKFIEFGNRPRQGHRTDLEVIKHDLNRRRPMTEISQEYFSQWCQYRRSFDEFIRLNKLNIHETKIILYHVDSTHEAYRIFYSPKYRGKSAIIKPYEFVHDVWDVLYSGQYEYLFIYSNHVDIDIIRQYGVELEIDLNAE